MVRIYFSTIDGKRPIFTGPNANVWFDEDPEGGGGCIVFASCDVTEEEYEFMEEYWDDTLEKQGNPEVYLPRRLNRIAS